MMKIFIIILMFIATIYALGIVEKNGKGTSSIALSIVTVAYDLACVYLLACVV